MCYENQGPLTIMATGIELRMFDQGDTSAASFWSKSKNAESSKTIVCQAATLPKLPLGGFLCIYEI